MFELFNIGIDEENVRFMIESNPNIRDMSSEDILDRIELLNQIGCDERKIRNILIGNPWYLDRCISDVVASINKLNELGLTRIDLMIDDNPMLLNVDEFEINDFVNSKLEEGYDMDEIIDMIDENSNIIVE